jgi:transposase InsO family protein
MGDTFDHLSEREGPVMPWSEKSLMDMRLEFVKLAGSEGANVSALCRRFAISRKTGYKWLARAAAGEGVEDRSRRPATSPKRTAGTAEAAVLEVRGEHPTWGGRKIRRRLFDLGAVSAPAASTISRILNRRGLIDPDEARGHVAFQRFEHDRPNALWQMDFKGHFAHASGRCHPLTVLDDHSRFSICLAACEDERTHTVREQLTARFRRYGLPERINVDNGSPWGAAGGEGPGYRFTPLTVWLARLGVKVSHSRPYHPQTNGKDERFHRTLKADVIQRQRFGDLNQCQKAFDRWRAIYNTQRPHQAIGMAVPASRYQLSARAFPETLPEPQYQPDDIVRKVQKGGELHFKGRLFALPKAFVGQPIGLRPTQQDGLWDVLFAANLITQIDLRQPIRQT